jgi:7,8-dihydropterin-6-yl-methyl-4-(beta-D-ribofuranosyl)aminobenzene 5'-phosphate synthase
MQVSPTPSPVISQEVVDGESTDVPVITIISPIPSIKAVINPTHTATPIKPALNFEPNEETQLITGTLTITVIYDNYPFDPKLTTAWGYSALIKYHDHTLLFDTGGDGQILMENMHALGIDPISIDSVVLSHAHDDHTGGLTTLLNTGITPVVYLLPSFPANLKRQIGELTQVSEVSPAQSLAEGIWTTGEVRGLIPEQALVIQTAQGLAVITGCAHPGIVAILEIIRETWDEPIYLVMGGFHLADKNDAQLGRILEDFRRLEVEKVAPSHCTGESAIFRFTDEYKQNFISIGAGSEIRCETVTEK